MSLITGYPEGSDITVMNVTYVKPFKYYDEEAGKDAWTPDYIVIVFRDNKTGLKHHQTIKRPDYIYYEIPKEYAKPYSQLWVPSEQVIQHKCKYRELEKDIYKLLGRYEEYKDNIYNGNYKENRKIHANPRIMSSDMNIEDHYRARFGEAYTNNNFTLHKAFFDIEADTITMAGDFPELGECEINCVSYYDEAENKVYTFMMRNKNNPLIAQFENEVNNPGLYDELYNFVINAVGGLEAANEFGVTGVKQEFFFFNKEIAMLKSIFRLIHTIDPDFLLAWNMAFDIPYIIQRINNLGYNVVDVMCNDDFEPEIKQVYYYIDERHKNELAERTDYAVITGNVVFLDQMLQFTQKRKSKIGSFTSFKLDDIGKETVGVQKLDYSHITNDIAKLPYLDYKTFVFYNIMDVVVQKCIEARCKDIENIFTNCVINNTSYRKGYRQTVYLANRIIKDLKAAGYTVGNNINRLKAQEPGFHKPEKYAGAIVTDVRLTGDSPKMKINGTTSMIVNNVIDEDYKALYPSAELENNIAPPTQIGKINMWNRWHAKFKYNGNVYDVWVKDLNNAYYWPVFPDEKKGDVEDEESTGGKKKKEKRFKHVQLFNDPNYREPFEPCPDTEYHPENFETISYEKVYGDMNYNRDEKYEAAGEFMENYMCQNSIMFSNRYFKFANFRQFVTEDLTEFLASVKQHIAMHHMINPIKHHPDGKIKPITEYPEGEPIVPIKIWDTVKSFTDYISDLKNSL